MQQPAAPSAIRNFQSKPLNHHSSDYTTESGIRISTPIYIDLTNVQRKELLNAIRTRCSEQVEVETGGKTLSGNRTVSYSAAQPAIEAFIGMTLEVLRSVIFARGGIEGGLLFRLQSAAGIQMVSEKELAAAIKSKLDTAKAYMKEHAYEPAV